MLQKILAITDKQWLKFLILYLFGLFSVAVIAFVLRLFLVLIKSI